MWKKVLFLALTIGMLGMGPVNAECEGHRVNMINAQGESIGHVSLKETPHGVLVRTDLRNLPQGWHAFHVHQTGRCDTPDFQTAGGHFNPTNKAHGFKVPEGHHLGDMPNVYVGADGLLQTDVLIREVTLREGPNRLIDEDKASVMIHEKADDYRSQPSGDAGGRIGCGVIE